MPIIYKRKGWQQYLVSLYCIYRLVSKCKQYFCIQTFNNLIIVVNSFLCEHEAALIFFVEQLLKRSQYCFLHQTDLRSDFDQTTNCMQQLASYLNCGYKIKKTVAGSKGNKYSNNKSLIIFHNYKQFLCTTKIKLKSTRNLKF